MAPPTAPAPWTPPMRHQKTVLLLDHCLAIQLRKLRHLEPRWPSSPQKNGGNPKKSRWRRNRKSSSSSEESSDGTLTPTSPEWRGQEDSTQTPEAEWALQNGYLLYQAFQEANLKCYWNTLLRDAISSLRYLGHVAPGTLLIGGQQGHLEVVRATWARKVLQPPPGYVIVVVGDAEGCSLQPVQQTQFTPLPEALCWVTYELGLARQRANLQSICSTLDQVFPYMVIPSKDVIYNTLGKLIRERKVYHTSEGYFIVTPNSYQKTSSVEPTEKSILLSDQEAIAMVHGQMETIRDGQITHQSIQCNLVDVIYGGGPGDKVVYARPPSPTSPTTILSRTGSLRLFGSKRPSLAELRGGSLRLSPTKAKTLAAEINKYCTEEDAANYANDKPEKVSMFSRLFRRSTMKRRSGMSTFQAQFPLPEWSNPGTKYLHSVGTQTRPPGSRHSSGNSLSPKVVIPNGHVRSTTSLPRQEDSDRRTTPSPCPATTGSRSSTLPRRRVTSPTSDLLCSKNPVRWAGRYRGTGMAFGEGKGSLFVSSNHDTPSSHIARKPPTGKLGLERSQSEDRSQGRLAKFSGVADESVSLPSMSATNCDATCHVSEEDCPCTSSNGSSVETVKEVRPFPETTTTTTGGKQKFKTKKSTSKPERPRTLHRSLSRDEERVTVDVHGGGGGKVKKTKLGPDAVTRSDSLSRKVSGSEKNVVRSDSLPRNPSKLPVSEKNLVKKRSTNLDKPLETHFSSDKQISQSDKDKMKMKFIDDVPEITSMNNSRKFLTSPSKNENLSYINVFNEDSTMFHEKNSMKELSINEKNDNVSSALKNSNEGLFDKEPFASEEPEQFRTYPSLSELNITFKSLTGQKILHGISVNSIDTLIEVNMAAEQKQNNIDNFPVRTDFGLV